jgi:hypothetical protein
VPLHAITTFSAAMNSVEAPWIPELRRAGAIAGNWDRKNLERAATLRRSAATDIITTPEPKSVAHNVAERADCDSVHEAILPNRKHSAHAPGARESGPRVMLMCHSGVRNHLICSDG